MIIKSNYIELASHSHYVPTKSNMRYIDPHIFRRVLLVSNANLCKCPYTQQYLADITCSLSIFISINLTYSNGIILKSHVLLVIFLTKLASLTCLPIFGPQGKPQHEVESTLWMFEVPNTSTFACGALNLENLN